MKTKMLSILNKIDQKLECLHMDFDDESWRSSIPSEPGWYMIRTNTPVEVLRSVGPPPAGYGAHINIPQTIGKMAVLGGLAITQAEGKAYVVYSGEAKDLKARAREHVRANGKTACLGLCKYPTLHSYEWSFCYVAASSCKTFPGGDKQLRLAVEQAWRAQNGWPILCRE